MLHRAGRRTLGAALPPPTLSLLCQPPSLIHLRPHFQTARFGVNSPLAMCGADVLSAAWPSSSRRALHCRPRYPACCCPVLDAVRGVVFRHHTAISYASLYPNVQFSGSVEGGRNPSPSSCKRTAADCWQACQSAQSNPAHTWQLRQRARPHLDIPTRCSVHATKRRMQHCLRC